MKRALLIVLLLQTVFLSWADETYIVEIKPTKKIVHVEQLGMSDNAGVRDVLEMMPELLTRGASSLLANYSIQVDGKDVGQAREVVLMQTRLAEVKEIEISTSPTSSEQLNGTGGVINIKLKPVANEGVSGVVMLDASTLWDVDPSVMINYRKEKFTLRSSVMMEYYRPTNFSNSSTVEPYSSITRLDTAVTSYKQETAKLYLTYTPTERDELKVHVWETFAMNRYTTNSGWTQMLDVSGEFTDSAFPLLRQLNYIQHTDADGHQLMAEANMDYSHNYSRGGKFIVEATYNYGNTQYNSMAYQQLLGVLGGFIHLDTTKSQAPHQVIGAIKTLHPLLASSSPHSLQLQLGVNANYVFGSSSLSIHTLMGTPDVLDTKTYNRVLYLSPYMQWDYSYSRWTVQAGARYQYYRTNACVEKDANGTLTNDTTINNNHCVTANVSLGCQVADGHHLRLLAARNIIRSGMTIYPVHNAELNYIFSYRTVEHDVLTNFGLQYINTQMQTQTDHVLSVNAQLFYRHGFFSMAFAGNVYAKEEKFPTTRDWGFYYNLNWTPVFSFRHEWTLSAKFLYNSKVETVHADYGDCFFAELRLSKNIRSWNIHAELSDVFDYRSYDAVRTGDTCSMQTYDLYHRYLLVGAVYKF